MRNPRVLAVALASALLGVSGQARAGLVYDNGPLTASGNLARSVSSGYAVTNSFTVAAPTTLTSAETVLWLLSGQTPTMVDWRVGTTKFGAEVASGTASLTNALIGSSSGGYYDVYLSTLAIGGTVGSGTTYWFTLLNAEASADAAVFWQDGGGPSEAWQQYPSGYKFELTDSEAFRLHGDQAVAAVPEPGSLGLLSLGLAAALVIRRRI